MTRHLLRCFVLVALCLPAFAMAQAVAPHLGSMEGLETLRPGRTMRASSSDIWNWEDGNSDARAIKPGETLVIADLEGPGRIRHIWNTVAAEERGAPRLLVLRMYWDEETEPSVEAPLGDFFVIGHGIDRSMQSLPVMISAEGRARNCFWPMPFRKKARITITNEGKLPIKSFYYYVDWQKLPSLPAETPYFHASYRQEYPTTSPDNYQIADIEGRGHYVGTVLNVRQHLGGWFGEGDDFFYIDGEKLPSLRGTGTEDYFCDAWGFREFSGPYYGVPVFDHYQPNGLITAYRWHIADPINFEKSLRVEIEHKGNTFDDNGKLVENFAPREEDFASMSYWYQLEPHKPFPTLPKAADRLYPDFKNRFEAEDFTETALVSRGVLESQAGGHWSNKAQLFWRPKIGEQTLVLPIDLPDDGVYDLEIHLTKSWDYGIFQLEIDGVANGDPIDLYAKPMASEKRIFRGLKLTAGEHQVAFRNVGKSEQSSGCFLGVDTIVAVQTD